MDNIAHFDVGISEEVSAWLDFPNDATSHGAAPLRAANKKLRSIEWPAPYCRTRHVVSRADARDMSFLADESVELVVTSPPYWTLKEY
jgi:site-specific DNA-methyltransferase (adenine-specific)